MVFRQRGTASDTVGGKNFASPRPLQKIIRPWQVAFDPKWGGPRQPVTFEHLEDWTNAAAFFDWAHQLSSGDVALKTKAAFMADRASEEELKELERVAADNPDDEEAQARLEEVRSTRIAAQVDERKKRVEQNPTDPQARFDLGLALYHAGEFSDAIPHLQQATRNPHIRTRVLLLLGRTFDAKGMHDLAVKQLTDANAELHGMDNTKKEILYELGLIHDKQGDKTA